MKNLFLSKREVNKNNPLFPSEWSSRDLPPLRCNRLPLQKYPLLIFFLKRRNRPSLVVNSLQAARRSRYGSQVQVHKHTQHQSFQLHWFDEMYSCYDVSQAMLGKQFLFVLTFRSLLYEPWLCSISWPAFGQNCINYRVSTDLEIFCSAMIITSISLLK